MTPQELKNSILQLAIQGKLVEQRPEEGTAQELYDQIQAEKRRLIKEGKLKKEKPLPKITEEEKPFEIPENWKWVRFGEVSQLLDGVKLEGASYPYLEAKYLRGKSEATFVTSGKFVRRGTKVILVDGENSGEVFDVLEDGYMGSTFKVLHYSSSLFEPYVLYFLLYHQRDYRNNKKGSAIPHLNKTLFFNMPTPLPPLAEQKRIVAKIEELLPLVDHYKQAWTKLEDFNRRFPEEMKKSILQQAIQGKLVEQRPEEGTAKELYDQIQAEKRRLIQAGKIKKEKPLPEITEEEKPFEIPEGWMWVKLGMIASVLGGKRIPAGRKLTSEDTGHKYIRVSDMKDGTVSIEGILCVPEDIFPSICRYIINTEDVYITVAGTIGRVGKVPKELDGANLTENADRLVFSNFDQSWLIKCLESNVVQAQIIDATTKVGQPKLAIKRIQDFLIPLPPLAEQKRIVARLEELLLLCERLKGDYT